ncbi:hypothetical protein M413DRAFT_25929 [Hebeloma cylindrosporum]|uniref:Uncharacterized protein n=1 Tax=Hebeloma cylindrosporum TaxID=76867 RepID=A0A0C3CIU9_HEBCY|nr:hypothetical protein M413DRAFT_25929 [Hebeloma cylindrosporum h7]
MSLVSQPDPSACSDEQQNLEVQDKIASEQDNETQNVGVNQYNTREHPPFVKPQAERKSANHDLIDTSGIALPSNELDEPPPASQKEPTTHAIHGDEENGYVTAISATKEPALSIEILIDSDYFESHDDGDLSSVVLADKGKGVSDFIELVGIHLDKGDNVDPELEGGDGMTKYEPGPSRIDFHDHGAMSSIPLESFKPTKTTDFNDGLPYNPTLPRPRLSWHPKISPYRFIVFSIPLAIGTVKAVLSLKGSVTTPITLEWISGVVIFLVLFLLGSYETRRDIPKYLSLLFKPDCVDLVWYLAAKLSIERPEYLSNERDLEFDPGAFVTSYRILVSTAVAFLGSLKTIFTFSNFFTDAIWMEWLLAAFVSSLIYLVGLYENNSLGLWSSFFRDDRSNFMHTESVTSVPIIALFLVVYSTQVLPGVKRITPNYFEEYARNQLPMGPTLSKGTLKEAHLVVVTYIPSIILFFCFLGPLIFYLRVPILASTFMLPAVIRRHTGRFVEAVGRLSQRRPIDRIIYHFVAFGQLLLFVGWNDWIFLFVYFVNSIAEREAGDVLLVIQILLYPATVTVLVYTWIIAATGRLGETRWWPSRDRLSRLVPPSITNATMTKFIQRQVKALRGLCPPGPSAAITILIGITSLGFLMFASLVVYGVVVPFEELGLVHYAVVSLIVPLSTISALLFWVK